MAQVGVRVKAVCPGYTRTKLVKLGLADGSIHEDWMVEHVPMGQLARPEEIADAVMFLADGGARYTTGQSLVAVGRWTVQGTPHAPDWFDVRQP